jgi:hypothetical protein
MKTLLLFCLSAFCFCTQAQLVIPKDSISGLYTYQDVVKIDSTTKQQLYQKTRSWILENLKSADNIIDLDDKQQNTLNASGVLLLDKQYFGPFGATSYANAKLSFKVSFQFKEGRFKYTFSNFIYTADLNSKNGFVRVITSSLEELSVDPKVKEPVLNDVNTKMQALLLHLKKFVSSNNPTESDW